jgi:CHASE3 domain sensor protein
LAWLLAGQWQSESSRVALEDLRARSVRLHHLDTLLLQMLDAESSVRGYLLTQNPVYLRPYQDGQAALESTLAALRADAWADERQRETVDHLALLVDMRWSLLTQRDRTRSSARRRPARRRHRQAGHRRHPHPHPRPAYRRPRPRSTPPRMAPSRALPTRAR